MKKNKNSRKLLLITIPILIIIIILTTINKVAYCEGNIESALRYKIMPLKTVVAGNGFEDMKEFKEILKDKQIVSMGESTHGTKEFFQMKHRMFEFLVEEMGYRLFAMEVGFGEAQVVNDYVLYGKGNAREALYKLGYWPWQTEEILELVEWMRNYNKDISHKAKVKFYGIDMQSNIVSCLKVREYLIKVNSDLMKTFNDLYNNICYCEDFGNSNSKYGKDSLQLNKYLEKVKESFLKNRDMFISKSSLAEYEIIYHNLVSIEQFLNDDKISRDQAMCENVKWILDYEKQFGNDKIAIWAHNMHVNTDKSSGSTGMELKKIYGDKLYTMAFDFYEGSLRGRSSSDGKIKTIECLKPEENTFLDILSKEEEPLYFLDFKKASSNSIIKEWLLTRQYMHHIGAETLNEGSLKGIEECYVPMNSFDGMVYVKNATAATSIDYSEKSINLNNEKYSLNLKNKLNAEFMQNNEFDKFASKLENKNIIAFTSPARGAKEFCNLNNNLFKYLVQKQNYRAILLNTDFIEGQLINNYVLNGKGDIKSILKGSTEWYLRTQEMVELTNWIREYNKNINNKKKIRIYGYNLSLPTKRNNQILIDYLTVVDKTLVQSVKRTLIDLQKEDSMCRNDSEYMNKGTIGDLKTNLTNLLSAFKKKTQNYISKTSKAKYNEMILLLNNFINVSQLDYNNYTNYGDHMMKYYMTENIKYFISSESSLGNKKVMISGTNNLLDNDSLYKDSMGSWIKSLYGDAMYTIGGEFYQGTTNEGTNNAGNQVFNKKFTGSNKGAFSDILSNQELSQYFLDLKDISNDDKTREWLNNVQLIHSFTSLKGRDLSFRPTIPSESYDGIIFIKNITPSTLLK